MFPSVRWWINRDSDREQLGCANIRAVFVIYADLVTTSWRSLFRVLEDIGFRLRKCLLRFFSFCFSFTHTHVSLSALPKVLEKDSNFCTKGTAMSVFLSGNLSVFRDENTTRARLEKWISYFLFFDFREIKRSVLCQPRGIFNRTTRVCIS